MNKFSLAETFITIADCGSIQKAAKKLHQTDATISKRLSKLEEHLGTKLIIREHAGLKLNDAGQRYYHEAKKAIEQINKAEQYAILKKLEPEGTLRVVSNQHYAETFIIPKLSAFLNRYPKINFYHSTEEIAPDFNVYKMDVLVGVAVPGPPTVIHHHIDTTNYLLCATKAYLKKYGTPQSTTELMQHAFISHFHRKPNNIITLDGNQTITLNPKLFLNNTQQTIHAALADLGFVWTHENLLEKHLKKNKLVSFLKNFTQQKINMYAYYERQQCNDQKINAFMDFFFPTSKKVQPSVLDSHYKDFDFVWNTKSK